MFRNATPPPYISDIYRKSVVVVWWSLYGRRDYPTSDRLYLAWEERRPNLISLKLLVETSCLQDKSWKNSSPTTRTCRPLSICCQSAGSYFPSITYWSLRRWTRLVQICFGFLENCATLRARTCAEPAEVILFGWLRLVFFSGWSWMTLSGWSWLGQAWVHFPSS